MKDNTYILMRGDSFLGVRKQRRQFWNSHGRFWSPKEIIEVSKEVLKPKNGFQNTKDLNIHGMLGVQV